MGFPCKFSPPSESLLMVGDKTLKYAKITLSFARTNDKLIARTPKVI